MNYSAVIAAAGLGSRIHQFKPMMCLGDETIIGRMIRVLRDVGVGEIVVVTGYRSEMLNRHLAPLQVKVCENKEYATTKMFDSVRLGLLALEEPCDYVFVTPADIPLVQPETLTQMQAAQADVVRPMYKGVPGHPIMISAGCIPQLVHYDGAGGLRGAIDAMQRRILDVAVEDGGVLIDFDTPDDFKKIWKYERKLHGKGKLWPDIQVHLVKGNTVLTPETAQYIEMIGHTGSIQSACSCMHMSYTKGWKLLNAIEHDLGFAVIDRVSGGSGGGGSRLTAAGEKLLTAYQTYQAEVKRAGDALFEKIFSDELA